VAVSRENAGAHARRETEVIGVDDQSSGHVPAPLLSKDAAEVKPQRFLELGTRPGGGLGVFELVDVDLEGNALALDPVELGREAAALVGLGEDELRALEASVVLSQLLYGLDDDALHLFGFRGRHRRKRSR